MLITSAASTAILFVNLTIPKKMFKSMSECESFKHTIEKQISAHYNPVDLFHRMPTLSCILKPPKPVKAKPVKPKIVKPFKSKIVKPVKQDPKPHNNLKK